MIRGGLSYGDRKIECLQALSWWVTDLTLRSKIINLNNFRTDILDDTIEESRLDFEDTRDGKVELINPKDLSHEIFSQLKYIIYNCFTSKKEVLVCPYLMSSKRICQVPKTVKTGM